MKKLLSVTFFSGLLTLAKMGSGFIIAKVVAVYTGPTGMAMLGQIQGIVSTLNGIINAPVSSCMVRYTAEYEKEGLEACSLWWKASTWWLALILSIVIPAGILFSSKIAELTLGNSSYSWLICVAIIFLPLVAIGTLVNSVVNGFQNYKKYIGMGALSTAFSCLSMVSFIIFGGIKGALFAAAVQSGLISVILILCVLRQPWFALKYWWGSSDREHKSKISGYILMAITTALTTPLALICVRNILISNVGWEATGQWQAVWKISEVYLGVITIALSTYFLPRLSTLSKLSDIRREINQTALLVIPTVTLMAVVVYLLRDVAINILFTQDFNEARNLFSVQLVGDVIKVASWLYAYPMISRGATKWYVFSEIFFALSFFLCAMMLVPLYLTQGANMAYLINYCAYFLFIYIFSSRFSK